MGIFSRKPMETSIAIKGWLSPTVFHGRIPGMKGLLTGAIEVLFTKELAFFRQTGKCSGSGKTLEVPLIRRNGTEFPAGLSLSAVKMEGKWFALGIIRDISDRKLVEEELKRLSCLDGLTGVANRRQFESVLQQEWRRMVREKKPLSLAICDVDFFKPLWLA